MTALSKLQSDFFRYVLDSRPSMEQHVIGTARVDAGTRLSIYGNAYRLRLVEALDANFPALHAWLGDEEFNQLGRAYIAAHPSQHYSIRWFGHQLPRFVATQAPWRDDGFVNELVQFEWAMSEVFDAADAAPLGMDAMAAVAPDAWPALRFEFHPSLRRLALHWNIPPIWRALTRDEQPEPGRATDVPITWIGWRQQLTLYYRDLEVDESWALAAAQQGANFAELCEGLCEWIDAAHVAQRAAGFLHQWISDGLIVRADH